MEQAYQSEENLKTAGFFLIEDKKRMMTETRQTEKQSVFETKFSEQKS